MTQKTKKSVKKIKKNWLFRPGLILGLGLIFAAAYFLVIYLTLPDIHQIASYRPVESTKIYSADGKIIATLHEEENRIVVPLDEISYYLKDAVIASEDSRFFSHAGIDFRGISRAVFTDLLHAKVIEGGSTITQQLARSLFLTRARTLTRKIAEMILALQIERNFSKDEILQLYLNQIYWGHNAYGIGAAANIYFGKTPAELTLAESALLGGLLKGPELYSPYKNIKASREKQKEVLLKMSRQGMIETAEIKKIMAEPIKLRGLARTRYQAPFFVDYVVGELKDKFNISELFGAGFKIFTTLDSVAQEAAEKAIEKMKAEGTQLGFSQMALLAIDPTNGFIKAMVGGVDYSKSQFNRTSQSLRQPGSAFKIFTYIAAFENGFSPGDIIDDSPVSYNTPQGVWDVQNYDLTFKGPTTLRDGLRFSRNVVTVKLLDEVGGNKVVEAAQKMGITSKVEPNLSLALGTSEVSLMELVSAFATLPAGGVYYRPLAILRVEDREGRVILENQLPEPKIVMDKKVADLMVNLLEEVVQSGTGTAANFGRPAAGKTGTTSDWKDAWFIGFTPQLAAGVWLGNDDNTPTQKVPGGWIPAKTWGLFMSEALKDKPVEQFAAHPSDLVKIKICKISGKLATSSCPPENVTEVWFWQDKAPQGTCEVHAPITPPNEEPAITE